MFACIRFIAHRYILLEDSTFCYSLNNSYRFGGMSRVLGGGIRPAGIKWGYPFMGLVDRRSWVRSMRFDHSTAEISLFVRLAYAGVSRGCVSRK